MGVKLYNECSDVTELSTQPRHHVGGILNVNRAQVKMQILMSTLFADRQCTFSGK